MKKIVFECLSVIWGIAPRLFVFLGGGIWKLRNRVNHLYEKGEYISRIIANVFNILIRQYWESYGSSIGTGAIIEAPPIFPHGYLGVFISTNAHIGKNVVIFQQVTIGSNTLSDSKGKGAPYIEDNVFIGAGAKIIGNVHIGKNARIGANCVVVKDVPANSVTVIRGIESIVKSSPLDNHFVSIGEF